MQRTGEGTALLLVQGSDFGAFSAVAPVTFGAGRQTCCLVVQGAQGDDLCLAQTLTHSHFANCKGAED